MSNFDEYGNLLIYSLNSSSKQIFLQSLRTGETHELKPEQTIISTDVINQNDINVYNNYVKNYIHNPAAYRIVGPACSECKITLYDVLRIGQSEQLLVTCHNGHYANPSIMSEKKGDNINTKKS
jgi:hypothetical protein